MKTSKEKTMMMASLGSSSGPSQKRFKNRPAPRRQAKETELGMSGGAMERIEVKPQKEN